MTRWTALIPFKADASAKSRLSDLLSEEKRKALSIGCLTHVATILSQCPEIGQITLLSPERPTDWRHHWHRDEGRGLNAELQRWRETNTDCNLLIIHTDLPLLVAEDIKVLLDAARDSGASMATDRHGTGTNALALCGSEQICFRFGINSRNLHEAERYGIVVISTPGLSTDLDTPEDLAFVSNKGVHR